MRSNTETPTTRIRDWSVMRAFIKALILYVLFNGLYLVVQPVQNGLLPTLSHGLIPGRTRFEGAAEFNLHRLLDDHIIHQVSSETYNIVVLGSSEMWGNRSAPEIASTNVLDGYSFQTSKGRPVRIYNLSLPVPDAFKDLILAQFLYEQKLPVDLIIIPYNYFSFSWPKTHELVQYNPTYARYIVDLYGLDGSILLPKYAEPEGSLWGDRETLRRWLIGQAVFPRWLMLERDSDRLPPRPLTNLLDLTAIKPDNRPGVIPALATFHQTTQIPMILMTMPAPFRENAFRDWVREQSAENHLPFLDCAQAFTDPAAFEDEMHIMPETQEPFARVLARIFSDNRLVDVAPGFPLTPTEPVEAQEGTCSFYPALTSAR